MTIAYISIGSNLSSPKRQADTAVLALDKISSSRVLIVSSYYRTHPLGPVNQPDYLNAAVALETSLDAYTLLYSIQCIEFRQGRNRMNEHWGPRTLDLDLMLFGDEVIDTRPLTIPHYDMRNRGFMLWPLVEIAPQLFFPTGESLQDAIVNLGTEKPTRWVEF